MLTIPHAPRFRMTRAPLVQAVAQVNFPIMTRFISLEGIAPLQEALADAFPYMTQQVVQEVQLLVGPAGPASPETSQSRLHKFTDDDGRELSITMGAAHLSIPGAVYAGVRDFADRFERVCAVLHEVGRLRRCDRLGVRYLDIVEVAESSDDWASWFRPEIVGISHPALSRDALTSSMTETRLQQEPGEHSLLPDAMLGVIRHGLLPPGSIMQGVPPRPIDYPAFVFDMDVYVEAPQVFEPANLVAEYRLLHREIESVFHWSVTDAGRKQFGFELEYGDDDGDE